jgi:protein-disulfide isomerase
VIVVFSDFQCAYCKEEAKVLRDNLVKTYPTQVRLYFKDYPLTQIHNWAKPAAVAGRCIFRDNPGAFWDYHDWIFDKQGEITAENLQSKVQQFAGEKSLDVPKFTACFEKRATEAEVDRAMEQGRELNVNSTPTMFLNGRRMVGKIQWEQLKQVIDFEIEYQKTAKNAGEDCGCEVKLPSPLNN